MTAAATGKPCQIVIVDEQTIMRDGLFALLAADPGYEVVATIDNIALAIERVGTLSPNVVIVDPNLPGGKGPDTVEQLKLAAAGVGVIVLTLNADEGDIHAALKAGADAYVLKDDSRGELFSALERLQAGEKYLGPSVCARVIECFVTAWDLQRKLSSPDVLTPRERDIIRLIATGRRTREIAEHFSLSPKTVDKHRTNLMKKLGLHSVSAVTMYAMQNGLVEKQ